MPKMLYKTKGNGDPKGKPRVYFTCHPEDFSRYFEKIVEDVFKTHDCAIYYTEDMTAGFEADHLETDLGQMNLFVVPVTWRLLSQPNRAMDADLAYAKQENIPILPFMMEQNIDEIYSKPEKFDQRQYLSPYSSDLTEIRYEEKLKKYLESVLISDKMAKWVRAAFDAYIFLSYRKKDRKYANELMKLIHKNPEYRDIAIWYDEFLTPGESFADNIKKALKDSQLFALLVTPNLLEEPDGKPNYVMDKEYPAAVRAGKDILPVEMEKTDRVALVEKFQDIPDCADVRDEATFQQQLLQTIRRVAITSNNNDPEHNFLIGLAYLEGIDVEVNRERGIALITSAAEAEVPEAMKQLVLIYKTGHGVEHDYRMAAEYQGRLVKLCEQKNLTEETKENAAQLLHALMELADLYYRFVKDISNAKRTYRRIIQLLDHSSIFEDIRASALAWCYNTLCEICLNEDKNASSAKIYAANAQIWSLQAEKKKENPDTVVVDAINRAMGMLLDGDMRFENGDLVGAEIAYQAALQTLTQIADRIEYAEPRPEDVAVFEMIGYSHGAVYSMLQEELRINIAIAYHKLGDVSYAGHHPVQARDHYLKSIARIEGIAQEKRSTEACRLLSDNYTFLGHILRDNFDRQGAQQEYLKSLALDEEILEKTQTVEARLDLAKAYSVLGDNCSSVLEPERALEYYSKALALAIQVKQEANTVAVSQFLARCYEDIAGAYEYSDEYEKAKDSYLQMLKIYKASAQRGTMESKRSLAEAYQKLAIFHVEAAELEAAETYCVACVELLEHISAQTGKPEDLSKLANGYVNLCDLKVEMGDLEGAEEHICKATQLYEQLALSVRTEDALNDFTTVCQIHATMSDPPSKDPLEYALRIYNTLLADSPNDPRYVVQCNAIRKMLQELAGS